MARARARTQAQVGPRPGADLPVVTELADVDLVGAVGCDVLAVPLARSREEAAPTGGSAPDDTDGPGADRLPDPRPGALEASIAYGVDLSLVSEHGAFSGAAGSVLPVLGAVPTALAPAGSPPRLVLLGVGGGAGGGDLRDHRRAGAALARATRGRARVATTALCGASRSEQTAFVEGFLLAAWATPRTGVTAAPPAAPGELVLLGVEGSGAADRAAVSARAAWRARDLTAVPSSVKTPAWIAEQAAALAADVPGLDVEVLGPDELAAGGFGGLLAVGAASPSPPRLVRVTWTPPAAAGARRVAPRHVVLVGKGITFDTGGLALKPRESMVAMKTDMGGAAVVLAAVLGAAELGLGVRVTALLPLAENSLGASSYRPGDVVTIHGGTTVEVANPDAEGRLVLADALHLADAELAPDVLVDVATLTGAAPLALGKRHAALFSDDDALVGELEAAAAATGERVWRLPLVEEYRASLDSEVADLRHVPAVSPGAGAVVAALFLREFTGGRRWAHLDVAGPSRADRDEHEVAKGPTGHGARLLLEWMEATS